MATFIPIADTVRTSLVYLMEGQYLVNTLHFKFATQPTTTDMTNLNTALQTWYSSAWKIVLSGYLGITQINTVGLWAANAPGVLYSYATPELGSVTGLPFPNDITWCASIRTALRGRSFRGRLYVPGIALSRQNSSAPNTTTSTIAGFFTTALSYLLTPANIANFVWVIASRYANKLPRVAGITTPVTAITGDLTFDNQRRRLPGRGS
jgi:hypothetical protein